MKSAQLHQEALIKRREMEQEKMEKSAAVNRYFDQWGKITSRYEQWTAPKYYKDAEESLLRKEHLKIKQKNLERRQEKLRDQLQAEKDAYAAEVIELSRPKSKTFDTNMLGSIAQNLKGIQNDKKRADLEAKLYTRWRYGMSPEREKIVLDSKSSHQALAKLSWMDKQVELLMTKQQGDKESEERQLRILEEKRKHDEYMEKCRILRDDEIKELRIRQENHIHELKSREAQTNALRAEESLLRSHKETIGIEYDKLESNSARRKEDSVTFYNTRRIKMLFRKRSGDIIRYITEDIAMANRIIRCANEKSQYIRDTFDAQLRHENEKYRQLDAMYESEVKSELAKAECHWQEDNETREQLIRSLMASELKAIERELEICITKQNNLLNIKESHIQAIEHSNDRLKNLVIDSDLDRFDLPELVYPRSVSPRAGICAKAAISEDTLEPPRFGRKKVAWI